MEVKWYWLFEKLGYYVDNGDGTSSTSADIGDVFQRIALFGIITIVVILFVLSYVLRRYGGRKSKIAQSSLIVLLLVICILKSTGVGPYIEYYPTQRGGGFIDLSVISNIFEGLCYLLFAFAVWLGGFFGRKKSKHS